MIEGIYTHDGQGRLILAGELGRVALVRAKSLQEERNQWQPYNYNWGLPFYPDTTNAANPVPPEPNERPAAKELNALWEENTRIREELRKMREDIRGLIQALVNTRKEASLQRGGGGRTQPREKPLSGL